MSNPRILLYDLETFPNKGYFWAGRTYETNILEVTEYGGLASVAWKFLGDKTIKCLSREGEKNDRAIVQQLNALFAVSDIIIAHNGVAFDTKTTNTNTIKYDIHPPPPYQQIDTKAEAKKHFRFDSNSLDALAAFLGVGRKLPHTGFPMWKECMRDDPRAWRQMVRYNKHDVFLLEGVYLKMRPWIRNHPGLMSGLRCLCGSMHLRAQGTRMTATKVFQRYQCRDCGRWLQDRVGAKNLAPARLVNLSGGKR